MANQEIKNVERLRGETRGKLTTGGRVVCAILRPVQSMIVAWPGEGKTTRK